MSKKISLIISLIMLAIVFSIIGTMASIEKEGKEKKDNVINANVANEETAQTHEEQENVVEEEIQLIAMTNVENLELDVALNDLKMIGFKNVNPKSIDGRTIFVESNWTVMSQNVSSGEFINSNTEIELICKKTIDIEIEQARKAENTYNGVEYDEAYMYKTHDGLRAMQYIFYLFSSSENKVLKMSHNTAGSGKRFFYEGTYEDSGDTRIVSIESEKNPHKETFIIDDYNMRAGERVYESLSAKSAINKIKSYSY